MYKSLDFKEPRIKIYLDEDAATSLRNDAELFEFFNKNGKVNFNGFLNTLIKNYYNIYEKYFNDLENKIMYPYAEDDSPYFSKKPIISKEDAALLALKLSGLSPIKSAKSKKVTISLTIRNDTMPIFESINEGRPNINTKKKSKDDDPEKAISLSEAIRLILLSYLSVPRREREKIMFMDYHKTIENAIKENLALHLSGEFVGKRVVVYPYQVAASKNESHYYLHCYNPRKDTTETVRVSRLTAVDSFDPGKEITIPLEHRKNMDMIKSTPQYLSSDIVHARIRLTEEGKKLFRRLTTNRPAPIKVEDDIYYFQCSLFFLKNYFQRLGKEAIALEPEELRQKLAAFFQDAADEYR